MGKGKTFPDRKKRSRPMKFEVIERARSHSSLPVNSRYNKIANAAYDEL